MDNLFTKEVINGNLIEIDRINVGTLLMAGFKGQNAPEHEKPVYVMVEIIRINGNKISVEDFLELNDFELFNFVSDSLSAMTNNNIGI